MRWNGLDLFRAIYQHATSKADQAIAKALGHAMARAAHDDQADAGEA